MKKNSYHVIGLMSGTSLDGVDLAYCLFTYEKENWIYKILNTTTFLYSTEWEQKLLRGMQLSGAELTATDHAYGRYLGEFVKTFIADNDLQPDFVSSHGHTIFHLPEQDLTLQIGHGAYLAAAAGLPVVCDFRTLDIALGGQGAPLVPIGDELLFGNYDFCLNLGGIANISFSHGGTRVAYDICACNMLLNTLANQLNLPYDQDGTLAQSGKFSPELLHKLNTADYFQSSYPKSLGKEWVDQNSLAHLLGSDLPVTDKLQTACHHIATQIAASVQSIANQTAQPSLLVTGGGAFNSYLVQLIREAVEPSINVIVPEPELINFKEALIFAFLGVLRWEQIPNCLSSVTGARQDNVGGAIYWG